jgi:hypothetical protein
MRAESAPPTIASELEPRDPAPNVDAASVVPSTGSPLKIIYGGHQAILEFLFGCDADVEQDRAGEFGPLILRPVARWSPLPRPPLFGDQTIPVQCNTGISAEPRALLNTPPRPLRRLSGSSAAIQSADSAREQLVCEPALDGALPLGLRSPQSPLA